MGFRVTVLSQQLSPAGSGVCCPQPPCNGSGKHVLCYTGSRWSRGRHTTQECGFSIHLSDKQKSAIQHSQSQFSSKHLPQIHAWLGRFPHSSISSATIFSFLLPTLWHALTSNHMTFPLHTRPCTNSHLHPFQP